MTTGRIQPNNSRLKRLIKDFGEEWTVERIAPMPCFNGGAGVLLRAISDPSKISNVEIEHVLIPANP